MNNFNDLLNELRRFSARVSVTPVGEGVAEISLPDHRQSHDALTIGLELDGDDWIVSDLGSTSFLLGDEFDSVVEAMVCAGSPFSAEDGALVTRSRTGEWTDLAERVMRFASHVGSVPIVWHSLACAAPRREQAPSTVTLMAREAKGQLASAVPRAEPFLSVETSVHGALDNVKAPLQFRLGSRKLPRLVAGCVDFTAGPQGEAAAKKLTSYLWDTVQRLPLQRYVIVRGSAAQVEHVANLYDQREVTTIPSDNLRALKESVHELVNELVGG